MCRHVTQPDVPLRWQCCNAVADVTSKIRSTLNIAFWLVAFGWWSSLGRKELVASRAGRCGGCGLWGLEAVVGVFLHALLRPTDAELVYIGIVLSI